MVDRLDHRLVAAFVLSAEREWWVEKQWRREGLQVDGCQKRSQLGISRVR